MVANYHEKTKIKVLHTAFLYFTLKIATMVAISTKQCGLNFPAHMHTAG